MSNLYTGESIVTVTTCLSVRTNFMIVTDDTIPETGRQCNCYIRLLTPTIFQLKAFYKYYESTSIREHLSILYCNNLHIKQATTWPKLARNKSMYKMTASALCNASFVRVVTYFGVGHNPYGFQDVFHVSSRDYIIVNISVENLVSEFNTFPETFWGSV